MRPKFTNGGGVQYLWPRIVVDHAVKAGDMLMVDDKMCWRASQEDGGWDGLAIEDGVVGETVRVRMIRMPAYMYEMLQMFDAEQ